MKAMVLIFALIIALFLVLPEKKSYAQDSTNVITPKVKKLVWMEMGVGLGVQGLVYTLSGQFQINESTLVSLVYDGAYYDEYNFNFTLLGVPEDYTSTKSAGALLGKLTRKPWGMITYSGGLAWVIATEHRFIETGSCGWFCSTYNKRITHSNSMGIPIDVKFVFVKEIDGFIINPFINLNLVGSYGGLKFSLAIGRMRNRPK